MASFFISILLLFFCLLSFFLSILKYYLTFYKTQKFELNDPFIDLSGIQSFSFVHTAANNPEYESTISNLGYTGELIFDCYQGTCTYYKEYECQIEVCDSEDNCHDENTICKSYPIYYEYGSSSLCRNTNMKSCNACSPSKNYTYKSCSCTHKKDSNDYLGSYSCTADNIIYNWKNLTYNRINQTYYKFNYTSNAVPSNEECPTNMQQCGILDELGNKLCYPKGYKCPINYITLNKTEKNYNYKEYTIDGVKIYYTNEAIKDGKVLGGFFVDSDLMEKYKVGECQIISTSKISELLNSNPNKLYRNSLNFDPYKDENIDKKGKAYLKWCIPGVGKERNITLIKNLNEDYELNKTANKNYVAARKGIKIMFFITLPGYIVITIGLTITTILIKNRNVLGFHGINIGLTLFFSIACIFMGLGTLSINSDLSELINKSNFNKDIFTLILKLNKTIFWMNIPLMAIIIIFMIYISCLGEITYKEKTKTENNYKNLEENNNIELQKKYGNNSEENYNINSPYDDKYQSQNDSPFPLIPKEGN